jgi:nucleoside-diphosphate-sugar epimerase
MAKVLVTGAGGYIGTQLVKDLLAKGHQVIAFDRYFFGMETLKEVIGNENLEIVKQDIRDVTEKDFKGVEIVCDLACLSNDPAGEIDPKLTYEINRDGRIKVADLAKRAGVQKYIISSSCSVYGQGDNNLLTEESKTNPVSVYAESTLQAEQQNLGIADKNFTVTALRNATVFGLSNRMRFDLVVNLMTLSAFQKNQIIVMGGGQQWRPLVHISDVSRAFINVISSKPEIINEQIFNIGLNNFQIKNLAYIVREQLNFPISIDIAPDDADKRNYNVIFEKASKVLNFKASTSINVGVQEIYQALKSGTIDVGIKTVTVQWYKNILEAKLLLDSISLGDRIL